jgi:hypothetical protein
VNGHHVTSQHKAEWSKCHGPNEPPATPSRQPACGLRPRSRRGGVAQGIVEHLMAAPVVRRTPRTPRRLGHTPASAFTRSRCRRSILRAPSGPSAPSGSCAIPTAPAPAAPVERGARDVGARIGALPRTRGPSPLGGPVARQDEEPEPYRHIGSGQAIHRAWMVVRVGLGRFAAPVSLQDLCRATDGRNQQAFGGS